MYSMPTIYLMYMYHVYSILSASTVLVDSVAALNLLFSLQNEFQYNKMYFTHELPVEIFAL